MDGDAHPAEALGVVVVRDGGARGPHALHDGAEVVAGAVGGEAEGGGAVHLPREAGRGDEGLGGDAAGPEAVAAERVLLDDGGVHAEVGRARGRDQAAGAAADRDEVVFVDSRRGLAHFGVLSKVSVKVGRF